MNDTMKKNELENAFATAVIPECISADFALRHVGDGMICDRIQDGDIVYIREQQTVKNGDIVAVLMNGETMIAHAYLSDDRISLVPSNPKYEPIVFDGEEMNAVRVLGKAVGFTSLL